MFSDDEYYDEYQGDYDYGSDIDYQEEIEDERQLEFEQVEQQYVAERTAFERVGMIRPEQLLKTTISGGNLEELNAKLFRLNLNDEEKFTIILSATFNNLKEYLDIKDRDLVILLELIPKIPYLKYKNSAACILGYYTLTLSPSKSVSKEKVNKVFKIIKNFPNISEPDIIRYARLIEKII